MMKRFMRITAPILLLVALLPAADWPDYRGPNRDGRSAEKGLVEKWSPSGENLLWKAPYGGRSTPVILNNRVYVLNPVGAGETLQERVMCLDADTGKVIWEYKYNVYHSDVPPHRIAWSAPAADPETGNVYVFGVGGTVLALDGKTGKRLWERTMVEDFGIVTTHGGRTPSPIVEGDLVIVSGITTGWGDQARAAHRFVAFDKRTGETVYVSTPGGRPFDTTYSPPVVVTHNGARILIAGGGDGTIHAIKAHTGEPVWKFYMSKRGVNTGVVVGNGMVYVSHSEENLDTNEMGLLAAVDINATGDVTKEQLKWANFGFQGGFSSPVLDGTVLYQIDNGSNLHAFDALTGKQLWKQNLGTIQKASPVLADGKIYVGNENGRFFILRPGKDGAEILSQVQLGDASHTEEITASAAVSDGRIFIVSQQAIYAIGKKTVSRATPAKPVKPVPGAPALVLVTPTELALKPGESVQLSARVYDNKGTFIKVDKTAQWSLQGLNATITPDGKLTIPASSAPQAGLLIAQVGNLKGQGRARVLPALPITENFDAHPPGPPPAFWINATGKYQLRDMEGNKVLAKLADNPFTKRARSFFGHFAEHDYTVQADVMAVERRRQMGDAGVVAQRYQLVLYGNHQRLELQPWQPETTRTVAVPFPWKKDTWYRVKLRVENMPDGKVKALGKAWPATDPEPDKWTIERIDPIGNHEGAPGIYADAPFEVYFDNIKVTAN
jgi:outer membrane protein assembly factor BamB